MQIEKGQDTQVAHLIRQQIDQIQQESQQFTSVMQSHNTNPTRCCDLQCQKFKIVVYIGVLYYLIQSIIYIAFQYSIIKKKYHHLQCSQITLECIGKIDNIYTKDMIYFELMSSNIPKQVNIRHIVISNQTHLIPLGLIQQKQDNVYLNYRYLWGITDQNLYFNYNITVTFIDKIPLEFLSDLQAIIRQQSSTINTDDYFNQFISTLTITFILFIINIIHKVQPIPEILQSQQQVDDKVLYKIDAQVPYHITSLVDEVNRKYAKVHRIMMMGEERRTLTAGSEDEMELLNHSVNR